MSEDEKKKKAEVEKKDDGLGGDGGQEDRGAAGAKKGKRGRRGHRGGAPRGKSKQPNMPRRAQEEIRQGLITLQELRDLRPPRCQLSWQGTQRFVASLCVQIYICFFSI